MTHTCVDYEHLILSLIHLLVMIMDPEYYKYDSLHSTANLDRSSTRSSVHYSSHCESAVLQERVKKLEEQINRSRALDRTDPLKPTFHTSFKTFRHVITIHDLIKLLRLLC